MVTCHQQKLCWLLKSWIGFLLNLPDCQTLFVADMHQMTSFKRVEKISRMFAALPVLLNVCIVTKQLGASKLAELALTSELGEITLQWRHYGLDGVSNHQPHDCLLNSSADHRKHQSSASFVRGINRWPDDVIMYSNHTKLWDVITLP